MNIHDNDQLQENLEAALDAAAPDGPSWLAGEKAFWDVLNSSESVLTALAAALDAAAPDGPSWLAGEEAFLAESDGGNWLRGMFDFSRADKRWPRSSWRETLRRNH